MGCFLSTPNDCREKGRKPPRNAGELAVFVPGLRIPKPIDFAEPLGDGLSRRMVERLSALRTRIIVMAAQEAPMSTKPRRTATQHGNLLNFSLLTGFIVPFLFVYIGYFFLLCRGIYTG